MWTRCTTFAEMSSRLVVGTAQFGQPYGVVGQGKPVAEHEVCRILDWCSKHEITRLDTAIAYGNSEIVLGNAGVGGFAVTTKLPPLPREPDGVEHWVRAQIAMSLTRLGIGRLDTVLLHHPADALSVHGAALAETLEQLRDEGMLSRIGVSIYAPAELESLVGSFPIDVVQAPMNAFDQRIKTSGWLARLTDLNIEVVVRSVFLQGLLLASPDSVPSRFQRWSDLWREWWTYALESGRPIIDVAMSAVLRHPEISGVLVGCESLDQLEEIFVSSTRGLDGFRDFEKEIPVELIDPRNWSQL